MKPRRFRTPQPRAPKQILDATAAEKEFTRSVIEAFEWRGWRVYHPTDSRLDTIYGETGKGFLDITALRGGRLVVAELKTEDGRLTAEQLIWFGLWQQLALSVFDGCNSVPIEVYTWRPHDMDEICRIAE